MVQKKPASDLAIALSEAWRSLRKRFVEAGGLLLAGTDPTGYGGVVPGYAGKREIELLVRDGGFSVAQAIAISTLNGAKFLGRDKDVGSLEVGKRADVVVIDGDPITDITYRDREDAAGVQERGRLRHREDLRCDEGNRWPA